jgi:acyl-coenzyme A thioesterase PaaI-like protein
MSAEPSRHDETEALTSGEPGSADREYAELARRTRELMDAQLRTHVSPGEASHIAAVIRALTGRLLADAQPGPLGVEVTHDGRVRNHGNAVVGMRNPIAPPLDIERSTDGKAWASFHLGALYEGPPGLVHGGVCALVLDQLLGEAAAAGGSPGMTGTLTLTYRRPTPLGDLSGEAWIDSVEGIKTTAKGHLKDTEGRPTVEAEGLFILPRWAREAMARNESKPLRFE